jgi:alcohol dehydrogenase class IV
VKALSAWAAASALDTAKAASVLATNGGKMSDYMGYHKVKKASLPLIAIPTTAGTGSEVTRVVVITDVENDVKMMCLDNAFMADVAIVDYSLTMSMPKSLTAFVGIDALTHAIEAYVSKKANPVADIFALLAIKLISENILTAYYHPDDEKARENMMLGANYAGIAFTTVRMCGAWHVPPDRRAFPHCARPEQRDASADRDRVQHRRQPRALR